MHVFYLSVIEKCCMNEISFFIVYSKIQSLFKQFLCLQVAKVTMPVKIALFFQRIKKNYQTILENAVGLL